MTQATLQDSFAHSCRRQLCGLLGMLLLAISSLHAQNDYGQDPPNRVARISVIQGNVSLEPNGTNSFSQGEINYPLTSGDRIYVEDSSLGEFQTAGLAVRLGNGADVTLSSLTDNIAQFGLAQGSIRVRTRSLTGFEGQRATVEVDTPNGAILVNQPGDIRVDSYPQDDTTVVTVSAGAVEVTGQNLDQPLGQGQSMRLSGSNPVYAEQVQLLPPDALDQFDQQREYRRQRAYAYQYVSPDMIGAGDLDDYGDWQPPNQDNQGYGAVWYPRGVPAGWTPYSNGHWAWVAPWGWTWVEAEPWGFAPFHYGRWASFGGRWGWVPGPPPSAFGGEIRPCYSPALVAFVGGGGGLSISIGGGGITAWFPLGPREVYRPWYSASPAYVNRVNVTNIYNTNVTEIHNTYINRTVNVYNTTNITNVTYVNRTVATVVVPQHAFASGQSLAHVQRIQLTPQVRSQLNSAPIVPHPLVTPATAMVAKPPARAVPPVQARPVVETRQGFERAGSPGTPVRAPQPPPTANRPGQAPLTANQPVNRAAFPQQRPAQVIAPAPVSHPMPAPVQAIAPRPAQQPEPARGYTPPPPAGRPQPVAPGPVAPVMERPVPRPPDSPRPLVNKTVPAPVQPPFEQQKRAIQAIDPGRPLGPQQVENLRNGRPAGPALQPEPVHPMPTRPGATPPAKAAKPSNEKEAQPPRN